MLFGANSDAMLQSVFGKFATRVPYIHPDPSAQTGVDSLRRFTAHPIACINGRRSILHIAWHRPVVARPEIDIDVLVCALHRVPAAACGVEGGAVAVRSRGTHAAPRVAVHVRVAVGLGGGAARRSEMMGSKESACVDER